ncbi:hypothetical protein CABS01_00153 [Colletotrichum abscissum]|uniref:uncharacterized protein n=1 Tax=Colletotrichum abscissum TaxID=1671311 RepID=UPI0027D751C1|nr:uncharacterized protein CABS01_00153 [Colletotrichum abscissum]KAK1525064.1 hypothetical protein CABS01_00153 [Colletotrichum abscissum]
MTFVSVCPFCISLYLTLGGSVIFPPSEDWEDSQSRGNTAPQAHGPLKNSIMRKGHKERNETIVEKVQESRWLVDEHKTDRGGNEG